MELQASISEYLERYDGSRWKKYETPTGGVLILTTRGQELMSYNPILRKKIIDYKNLVKDDAENDLRKWFRAGGNGDVYTLGEDPLVVKEASTAHSLWSSLDRMDYLHGICLKQLPAHIRVPEHYGIFFSRSPRVRRQYSLMEKVNDGLTVADLINGQGTNWPLKEREQAMSEFQGLEEVVRDAIKKAPNRDMLPGNLLPDWDAGNTIVDFYTPTRAKPFTFWIIDQ